MQLMAYKMLFFELICMEKREEKMQIEETSVSVLGIGSSMSTQIHIWVLWTEGCKDTSEPPDALVMKWDIELGTEFLFYPSQRQR